FGGKLIEACAFRVILGSCQLQGPVELTVVSEQAEASAARAGGDVDVLEHLLLHGDGRSAQALRLLLLNGQEQVVERFARPDLGDRRIIAAATYVLQPGAFAFVLQRGPPLPL